MIRCKYCYSKAKPHDTGRWWEVRCLNVNCLAVCWAATKKQAQKLWQEVHGDE